MKKKSVNNENYLERKPMRTEGLTWTDDNGEITLAVENTGVWNTLAQKLLKKPRVSYIHLDKTGSFIWPRLDGEKTIIDLGSELEAEFGDEVQPLYERLAKYFQILESYNFIYWNK